MGLIIPRVAEHFGVDAVSMSSQITWFTGGVFVGYLLSFLVFDRFTIKQVLLAAYAISLVSILLIHFSSSYVLLAGWLKFDNSDRFDITGIPNRHMAFGKGAHFCLGNLLARLDMEIMFTTLLREFPGLRLTIDNPEFQPGITSRGLKGT